MKTLLLIILGVALYSATMIISRDRRENQVLRDQLLLCQGSTQSAHQSAQETIAIKNGYAVEVRP